MNIPPRQKKLNLLIINAICFFLSYFLSYSAFADSSTSNISSIKTKQETTLDIIGNGPLLPKSSEQAIPIAYKNLNKVDIEILKVSDVDTLLKRNYINDNMSSWRLDDLQNTFDSVFADRYTLPKAKENQPASARLPIPQSLKSGWYVVVIKTPGSFYKIQSRMMLLTDMGIQARLYKDSSTFSVSSLTNGELLPNINISIYSNKEKIASLKTNKEGIATYHGKLTNKAIIVAESEDHKQYSMLPLKEVPLDLSEFQIGGREYQDYEAYIYSNRDLVKPGETLPINVLLRDQDGVAVLNQDVTLRVINPKNETAFNLRMQSQAAGYFSYNITTSKDWDVGRYTVQILLDPSSSKPIGEFKFQLEEFVPERMDLILSNYQDWVALGSNNSVDLEGRYLFGSPAAGNIVNTDINFNPVRHFKNSPYSDYFIGESFNLSERHTKLDEQKLSKDGKLTLAIPTPNDKKITSPVHVSATFSLQESGGAAVQRYLNFMTSGNSNIPGILPADKSFDYNSLASFDVALLSKDGQKLVSGDVLLEFMYDRGKYYWVYEDGSGWKRKNQERWKKVSEQNLKLTDKAQTVTFPVEWGDYRLIATDKATNKKTSVDIYAGWYWWGDDSGNNQLKAKPDHLTLSTTKASYQAGETATIVVNSPIKGSLLLALESDHLLWSQSQVINKGRNEIKLPINRKLARHDIYITGTLTAMKGNTPKRYFGITPLVLNRADRKLTISAQLPDRIEPLEPLTIPIQVGNIVDDQKNNTWVTLSIVDKGIINLSRFKSQDPFNYLFGQRRYSGDIVDYFSRIFDNKPNPFAQPRFGSDLNSHIEDKNDDLVESKTIILMSKAVKLVDGKANIKLDIPDYNGEGQVIVTAFNNRQVGQSVQDNKISPAVVAELSVPKFFAPGDQSTVTVDVFNLSRVDQTFQLDLNFGQDIKLLQDMPDSISLKADEHWTQSIPVQVVKNIHALSTTLVLNVGNDKHQINRSWFVPIHKVEPWLVNSKTITLQPNLSYIVDDSLWQGLERIPEQLGALSASYIPQIGITKHADGLIRYPYGCAEQTTSTTWPFILKHPELELLQRSAIDRYNKSHDTDIKGIKTVIMNSVSRLKTMQKANGSFSLWRSTGSEDPWLSVYVTDFLIQANKAYPDAVPDNMLERAVNRVSSYVNPKNLNRFYHNELVSINTAAYAAYLSAQQGKINYSDLTNIDVTKNPLVLNQLHMAYAYAKVGATQDAATLLDNLNHYRTTRTGYWYDYGSDLRDYAKGSLILDELSQNPVLKNKAIGLRNKFVEETLQTESKHRWFSTQERIALVQAAIMADTTSKSNPIKITVNNQPLEDNKKLVTKLQTDMVITNTSPDPLYIKLNPTGYMQLDNDVTNQNNSYNTLKINKLSRSYFGLDGKPLDKSTFKVGDRFIVVVSVSLNENVNDALIVDTIPAGFVLENANLSQGATAKEMLKGVVNLSTPEHVEYRNDRFVVADAQRRMYDDDANHYAYILRAEVPGTFLVPPISIESMYTPEKHAFYWQQPKQLTIKK